ncbi:hypothetical protein AAVH_23322 [Aphelenchoides avenae]|nr:hypothetical protein AAVH_23322 [Aphelenchus avenae]
MAFRLMRLPEEEVQDGGFRNSVWCIAFVPTQRKLKQAFVDTGSNQIVHDEAVGNDASLIHKRMEAAAGNGYQERVVIERAEVNTAEGKAQDKIQKKRPCSELLTSA